MIQQLARLANTGPDRRSRVLPAEIRSSGLVTDYLLLFPYTASKIWEQMLSKILLKNNGRNEIFEKKIHGKEVSHDRAIPLSG